MTNPHISVVIPCYREKKHVLDVISRIPDYVNNIICVDDCCPDKTGTHIKNNCTDDRVSVISLYPGISKQNVKR